MTKMLEIPSSRSPLTNAITCWDSLTESALAGSSSRSSRALKWIARTIATACFWPPESSPTVWSGSVRPMLIDSRRRRRVMSRILRFAMNPNGQTISFPMKMLR